MFQKKQPCGIKMAKLILTGAHAKVTRLKKHLEKEHPSWKGKMKIRKSK